MSQVIGLANIKSTTLQLVIRNKGYDARVFPGDTNWEEHLAAPSKLKKIAIVEDKRYFKKALEAELPLIVVCINDLEWILRREIPCLDGQIEGDAHIQLAVTPDQIYKELNKSRVYSVAKTDAWLSKSNPEGRCAGCKHLHDECAHSPTPTAKRPCGSEWELDNTNQAYRSYNLSQLIHLALKGAEEDLLVDSPQEFWRATYAYALDKITMNDWIAEHARLLKSAGASKSRLQMIVKWIRRYGQKLQSKKLGNPPSKLDIRLSQKLLK